MKNLFKINLAMMLALFLISSCKKDEVVKPDVQEDAITTTEMQNKANPFDVQGVLYNGFLNAISTNDEKDLGNWDVGQLAQFRKDIGGWDVGQIASNNGIDGWDVGQIAAFNGPIEGWDVGQVISFAMAINSSNGKESGDKANRNLSMQLEAFTNLGTFSPIDDCLWRPDRCKHTKLALAALDLSNGGTAHDRTLKFISIIRDQEADIQKNGEMNEAEKKAALILSSIARHTAGYWFNQTRERDEPNNEILINMIQLSSIGVAAAMMATDSEEVGVGTAILSTYIATGRAK